MSLGRDLRALAIYELEKGRKKMGKVDLKTYSKDDLGEYIARKLPKEDLLALAESVQEKDYDHITDAIHRRGTGVTSDSILSTDTARQQSGNV